MNKDCAIWLRAADINAIYCCAIVNDVTGTVGNFPVNYSSIIYTNGSANNIMCFLPACMI